MPVRTADFILTRLIIFEMQFKSAFLIVFAVTLPSVHGAAVGRANDVCFSLLSEIPKMVDDRPPDRPTPPTNSLLATSATFTSAQTPTGRETAKI